MDAPDDRAGSGPESAGSGDEPIATLRGAGVRVDGARAARVAVALALVALVAVGGVLLVAGIRKNAQIDELRTHGVPVPVTVTHCLALIGGTGQSPAGYECTGTYRFHGTQTQGLPGVADLPVGSVVAGVVSSQDPGLLSTPAALASEHTSASVYVLPVALLAAAAVLASWLLIRRRRRRSVG